MNDKLIAKRDVTYCVNSNCSVKDNCFKYQENYIFSNDGHYSFCKFNGIDCYKGE